MPNGKITAKQREILEFIKREILQRGYPPAVRDICEAVSLKSTSSVHSHLETLEKNGYIRRDPTKPRAIEILEDDFNLTRRELVNVPIVGSVAAGSPILAVENIEGDVYKRQPLKEAVEKVISKYGAELPLVPFSNSQAILITGEEKQIVSVPM